MKKILILGVVLLAFIGCKDAKNNEKTTTDTNEVKAKEMAYASFGEKIEADNALSIAEMNKKYDGLKVGDTLNVKFAAEINSVCTSKGCWMRLNAGKEKEVMVKFKDYGFFMPLDAKGEVVVNGKAFVAEVPVAELKHYAEDAGKSAEEIAKITEPKKTLSFIADGVLLKN